MAMFMPHMVESLKSHLKRAAEGETLSYSFEGEDSTKVHYSFTTDLLDELGLAAECNSSNRTISFPSGGSLAFRPFG